jgi:GGDEF domain-containing protein
MAQSILNKLTMFNDLVPIIASHHERIDGSGYPLGLKGHTIPMEAQIIAVADCFDAMTTRRIYKNHTMTQEQALLEIENLIGKHFSEHVGFAALSYFHSIQMNQIHDQRPQSLLEYERFSFFFKDQLTKLYNQNFLDYLRLSNEHNYAFCSCLCIDKFYKYNDTYGWKEGDFLLSSVAEYLQTLFTQASLFKTKGDTFLILSNEKIHFDFNNFQTAISTKSDILFLLPIHNKSIDTLLNYLDL